MEKHGKLTDADYQNLERSYISPEIADRAGIFRIGSLDGRDLVGRKGSGDFNGLVFPYLRGGRAVAHRLRLDHPPVKNGKTEHKYLQAPGSGNRIYFPPAPKEIFKNVELPIVISEGEKKCLALWRMAAEKGDPAFLPISFSGVYSWHGVIGKKTDSSGARVDEKGPIADLEMLAWKGRRVTILYDSNSVTNAAVQKARRELAGELTKRGAEVLVADLPPEEGVNGCDDYLALHGTEALQKILEAARQYDWKAHLIYGNQGPYAMLENAALALEHAPEWAGVLAYDEFRMQHIALKRTPWGHAGDWNDAADIALARWFQHQGIRVNVKAAADAAFQVAQQSFTFHPVQDYLGRLQWDRTPRLDTWLFNYLGVELGDQENTRAELVSAMGAAWMISAVARIYKPGCKADHMLVIEGPQGIYKSMACRKLAEPWFSDDMPALGTKDAQQATRGKWIMELAELEAMTRTDWARIKAFVSRETDHYRPPYGRHFIDAPRQCVLAGTINYGEYLEDETGGRRFWPVRAGKIRIDEIERDRDQLWAEAVSRFRKGEKWYLVGPMEVLARKEQEERFEDDAWEPLIERWVGMPSNSNDVSATSILEKCLSKRTGDWNRADQMRVAKILRHLGWRRAPRLAGRRLYTRKDL